MKENILNSLQQNCQDVVTAGQGMHPLVISGPARLCHKYRENATTQPLPLLDVRGVQPEGDFFSKILKY